MKKIVKSVIFILVIMMTSNSTAQTIESIGKGRWADAAVWAGGRVPAKGDAVEIKHDITVDTEDAEAGSVKISFRKTSNNSPHYGFLTVANGGKLTANKIEMTNLNHKCVNNGTVAVGTILMSNGSFESHGKIVSDNITLSNGTLTNKGEISSTMVVVSGGNLDNAKSITTKNIAISGGSWSNSSEDSKVTSDVMTISGAMYNNNRGMTDVLKQLTIEVSGELGGGGLLSLRSVMDGDGNECLRNYGRLAGTVDIYGNVYNEGSMEPRVDDRICRFVGNNMQRFVTTRDLMFNYLVINNTSEIGQGVRFEGGNVVVKKKLTLARGVVYVDDDKYLNLVAAGIYKKDLVDLESRTVLEADNKESYVDGLFMRTVNTNRRFLFPVGNNGKSAFVVMDSNYEDTWGIRYRNEKPAMTGRELNSLKDMVTYEMLSDEYWEVSMETCNYGDLSYSRGIELRLSDEARDNFLDDDATTSALYRYDNGDANATWVEIDGATKLTHPLYDGELVGIEKGLKILPGRHDEGKAICFAIGAKSEVIDKIIEERRESGPCIWTGRAGDNKWHNGKNWLWWRVPTSVDEVMVKDEYDIVGQRIEGRDYPIVSGDDEIAHAGQLVIGGDGVVVTLDGGALVVEGEIVVEDDETGHIVINNMTDGNSALKYGEMDYGGAVVNRELMTEILYYTGSATEEGTFKIDDDMFIGRLTVYNALKWTYEEREKMDGHGIGGTLGIRGSNGEKTVITQTGRLYGGDGKIELAKGVEVWNLIINPYMYGIDMAENGFEEFNEAYETVWFRKYCGGAYICTTYNVAANIGVSEGRHQGETESVLAPQQGFFVLSVSADDPYVKINRETDVCYGSRSRLKNGREQGGVLRLEIVSGNGIEDEMAIVMREGGSMDVTNVDSRKKENQDGMYNQIYAYKDRNKMSIPFYPEPGKMVGHSIEIGMRLANGERCGVIKVVGELNVDGKLFLRDKVMDKTVELTAESSYAFETESGGIVDGRFEIMVAKNDEGNVTKMNDLAPQGCSHVKIYDMSGRVVGESSGMDMTKFATMKKGIYVVEERNKASLKRYKVIK